MTAEEALRNDLTGRRTCLTAIADLVGIKTARVDLSTMVMTAMAAMTAMTGMTGGTVVHGVTTTTVVTAEVGMTRMTEMSETAVLAVVTAIDVMVTAITGFKQAVIMIEVLLSRPLVNGGCRVTADHTLRSRMTAVMIVGDVTGTAHQIGLTSSTG
jgi:hypothetical protein